MDLERFKQAQAATHSGFATALSELQSGEKRSHWIWYIFPQLAGLGRSSMAMRYGLEGVAEAEAYWADPVLRVRLVAVTDAVATHLRGRSALTVTQILGSTIDAQKLVSSLTLFRALARRSGNATPDSERATFIHTSDLILEAAAREGFRPCTFTLTQLNASSAKPNGN